jgi:hypothetical protein
MSQKPRTENKIECPECKHKDIDLVRGIEYRKRFDKNGKWINTDMVQFCYRMECSHCEAGIPEEYEKPFLIRSWKK